MKVRPEQPVPPPPSIHVVDQDYSNCLAVFTIIAIVILMVLSK